MLRNVTEFLSRGTDEASETQRLNTISCRFGIFRGGGASRSFIRLQTQVVSENEQFVALKCAGQWTR